ncbi:MAG TPA: phenylalanine--tRNA ligase subunit alpha [Gaiellaceae bacterium]|nr:phenylalanine--tRNA ligase subunit alpha [Gaiellaceae bacterium]
MGWETDYLSEAREAIVGARSETALEQARVKYLGRRSRLNEALRGAKDISVEERAELNRTKTQLEGVVATAREELRRATIEQALTKEQVDVTLPGLALERGHLHLITQIRREVEDVFVGLGYEIFDGPEVETTYYNFTALNTPEWHPSRSHGDTFYVADDLVLRTHTSPGQVRYMESHEPPVYMISLGRVYRRDTPDPTRYPIFHQVEGLAVDKGITLADLKGTLMYLSRALFGPDRKVRIRTSYFPFTEPSIEFDVSCFRCGQEGCPSCRYSGWLEMGGAGVVDPNVFGYVGYDPEEVSGFAFGLGLERIAMLRHGLPDLRELWENDLRLLRQF